MAQKLALFVKVFGHQNLSHGLAVAFDNLPVKFHAIPSLGIAELSGGELLQEIHSNFRLIVATNQDLEQLVESGKFRKDFYYRVYQAIIEIRPLRDRKEDILPLAEHYVQTYGSKLGKTVHLAEATKDLLLAYPWPGNVRELMSVLHRAVVQCKSAELLPQDFQLKMRREALLEEGKRNDMSLEAIERWYVEMVLESANGNIAQACKILGIDRSTFYRKIKNNGA